MFIVLRVIVDILAVIISFVFTCMAQLKIYNLNALAGFPLHQYVPVLWVSIFVYLLSLYFMKMYETRKGFLLYIDELIGCFLSVSLAWIVLVLLTFLRVDFEPARPLILVNWPPSFLFFAITREVLLRMEILARAKGYGMKNAAIIGTEELAKSLADRIKSHPAYGVRFVGFIGTGENAKLGSLSDLVAIVAREAIQVLYVADKAISRAGLAQLAAFCDKNGITLGTVPDVFEILSASPSVQEVDAMPIVTLKQVRFTLLNRFIKRTFDIFLALFGLLIFAVPMVIISFLTHLTSPGGPAIYRQERVGRGGRLFELYKFRTMIPDAEAKTGPVLATADDPRKTPFGRFLRATNLDELPQLFNILKGEMSFVGPRPERPMFVEEYKEIIPKYMERHNIRPGLAGWAQLLGGYHLPAEEKIKYDLYYIENWSFLLDIKIILKYLQVAFSFQREN
jgi:exopolysaccharide biosynthesis polyprenyl glycosylphosphotransferase